MKPKLAVLAALVALWVWTSLVASIAVNPNGVVYRNLSPYVWFWRGVPVEATYTPGGGTPIKSVQHVSCNMMSGTGAIAAVNLSYSVISYVGSGIISMDANMANYQIRTVFASTTGVACSGPAGNYTAVFDVIEFMPAAMKHATARDLNLNVVVGANAATDVASGYTVNLAKTMAFFQGCSLNNVQTIQPTSFYVSLPNTTVIRVNKNVTDFGFLCAVGLAEFN